MHDITLTVIAAKLFKEKEWNRLKSKVSDEECQKNFSNHTQTEIKRILTYEDTETQRQTKK